MPSSLVQLVTAYRRRLSNLPGPVRATGEVSNGEPVMVELLVGGEWIDLAAAGYVLVRDDSGKIEIKYGIQGGEGSQTERATATLQLRNTDGRFSPRNPTGPYYSLLNWRNARMRISVPDGLGGKSYRLWGEVSDWSVDWEKSGNDVWVDIVIAGPMQRLAQGPAPERSIIYRAITEPDLTGLVGYWPCEDASGATSLESALVNGSPMTWTGAPSLAAYDGFGASDPLPTLTGASLTGGVAKYDTTSVTQYQVRYLLAVPAAGFTNLDVISRIAVNEGAYTVAYLDVHYNDPPGGVGTYGGPGTMTILLKDGDQADIGPGTGSLSLDVRGRRLRVSVEVANSGTALAVTLRVLDVDTGITDSVAISMPSTQVTRVTSVSMAPDTLAGDAGVISAAVGHVTVQTTVTDIEDIGRAIQPTGEAAGRRIERLCAEEGIPFDWVGSLDDTVPLGPQPRQNLLSLVQEACLADGGLLYENRAVLGLGYRTRASLYNQDPALVLSYPGFNLSETPVPVDDDRSTQNMLTVTVGGVSATYERTEGPLGTAAIGRYGETSGLTLNLATSDTPTLLDHAAWRVHLGTVDEARFPQISVNLAHSSITPDMRRAILGLRLGDRIQITDPPDWLPPDTIDQLVLGMTETINRFEHRLSFVCAPASPYSSVGVLDAAETRIDIDSVLVSAVSSSATSLVVAPAPGEDLLWTTDTAEFPFRIRMGGEVMTATAGSDWLSDTFARSVSNGWGTSDTSQVWSTGGGTSADYNVTGTVGTHTLATTNASRRCFTDATFADVDMRGDILTSAAATGGSLFGGLSARYMDSSNFYTVRLEFTTANALILSLRKFVGAVETQLATFSLTDTYTPASTWVRVRFQVQGATLRARAWLATVTEPAGSWQVTATDSSLSTAAFLGTRSISASTNTNVNPVVSYDNLRVINPQTLTVTRSVNGVVKAHAAGAPISLATPTYLPL